MMARSYDNWERLVRATLSREDLRLSGQRTPSDLSLASLPSFSTSRRVSSFNFSSLLVGDSFSYRQILQATDFLSASNLIKRGHSGDFFYGVLEGGTQVVVKKIDFSSVNKESLFISELEILGKISHYRLIPLLGHCLENENEKFLVYKHMANKDLATSLSTKIVSGNHRGLPFLDWITRLNIATEAAETLSYLHHECDPPLVHRDIQASSILLDDKFEVRLGSLYKVCAEEKDISANRVAREFEQGTFGTSNANYATCAYDVYSFGKVLLELVTGKLGFSATDDSRMKDWIANALAYILPDEQELIVNIVDSSLFINKHLWQAWAVGFIAKACLTPESSKRPRMAHILLALEHIKSARFTSKNLKLIDHHGSVSKALEIEKILHGSEIVGKTPQATANKTTSGSGTASRNHGISEAGGIEETYPNWGIFAHYSLTIFSYSELKVSTKNFGSDAVMREDDFGTVYRAWLQDRSTPKSGSGSLVAIRKLYSQNSQLLKDWQSCVRLLGRRSHPHLVKFLGHCLEGEELFIVHEFMQSGSLEDHLCRTGSDVQPLSWDTRLKILIGTARGLAFLHAAEGQGFYESFDTSDILLDGFYNVKISGFGTAKAARLSVFDEVHPNFFKKGRYFRSPPENILQMDIPTGLMNVKSDVYGFGVVLVATLTGLPTTGKYRYSWSESHPVKFFKSHLNLQRNQLKKFMDPRLEDKYSSKAALKLCALASSCLQDELEFRPSMKQVVEVLARFASTDEEAKESGINQTAYNHGQQPRQS